MDESAVAAICAVPPELQGGDAERFFDLIIEMCGEGVPSFDQLIPQFEQRAPGLVSPATQFSDNLRRQGLDGRWPDIAQTLVSEAGTGSALAALRDQYAAGAGEAAGTGAEGDDTADWDGFRAQNADFWAGWNGADWATWRAAFAERLPAELNGEVEPHLAYLDGLDPAGQLSYLRDSLGFTINEEALAYYQYYQDQGADTTATAEGSAAEGPDAEAGASLADPTAADAEAPTAVTPPQEQEAQLESTVLPDIADQLSDVVPEEALSDEAGEDAFLDQLAGLFAEENAAQTGGADAG